MTFSEFLLYIVLPIFFYVSGFVHGLSWNEIFGKKEASLPHRNP